MSQNIQTLRAKFATLYATLSPRQKSMWGALYLIYKDVNLSPEDWIETLESYIEGDLINQQGAWEKLRKDNPYGWGEDLSPATQIEGWSAQLTTAEKAELYLRQLKSDLATMNAYEDYLLGL